MSRRGVWIVLLALALASCGGGEGHRGPRAPDDAVVFFLRPAPECNFNR